MGHVVTAASEGEISVQLWAARIPRLVRFAEHHWLVVRRGDQVDRWEVWQDANCGGESRGHLHRNLNAPNAGIRDNQANWKRTWSGVDAEQLARRIESSPESYPWRDIYRYVPGPNSNTYVQWCLQDRHRLSWRGIGRGYADEIFLGRLRFRARNR